MIGLHQEVVVTREWLRLRTSWNTTYNRENRDLVEQDKQIASGLAKRIVHYARVRLTDCGWGAALEGCEATIDGWNSYGDRADEATYCVHFHNDTGSTMGVQGIQINKGWPCLDHGIFLEE